MIYRYCESVDFLKVIDINVYTFFKRFLSNGETGESVDLEKAQAYGVETAFNSANLVLIPVPWEVTASYGRGTAQGPELIREASFQLDVFSLPFKCSYNHQIYFETIDPLIQSLNKEAKNWAQVIQTEWTEDKRFNKKEELLCEKVNQASESLLEWIYERSLKVFQEGKIPALVGGEHSVSEGLIRLIGEKSKGEYGILHIDAHADLRESFQGFKCSHASVMHNVLKLEFPPKKLVQLGVRDFCEEEYQKIKSNSKISCYFDEDISSRIFSGEPWMEICKEVISLLPSEVYVSLDMDGLSWENAPGTGTPVPGGLSFSQLLYLFSEIQRQDKKLIAFDVVETAGGEQPNAFSEWNGNVAARLIYYLSGLALLAKGHIKN